MSLSKKFLNVELSSWLLMVILLGVAAVLLWYGEVSGIFSINPWAH